jgi:two-component system, cell cycle sensor histidine kinase and response regulator CckA
MHEIGPSKQQLLGKVRVLEERLAKLKRPDSKQAIVLENLDFASGRESILRSALDCILTIDVSGVILEFNPEAERTFGYEREEVLGTMLAEKVIPEWLRQQHMEGFARYLSTGESSVLNKRIETTAMRSSGEEFPVELAITPVRTGNYQIFTAFVRDLTERKRTEKALQQSEIRLRDSQKMEAVGRLAGGVAHDFNNLLTVVLGCSELIQMKPEDTDFVRMRSIEIQEVAQRASELTQQLLTLSRRHSSDIQILDLNEAICEAETMLRRILPASIDVATRLEGKPLLLFSDPSQLNQTILNLMINACDAITDSGEITLTTYAIHVDQEKSDRLGLFQIGPHVVLEVKDNGHGMPPEVVDRAFEPFFTTKEVGKGSGLGLATVYGIVKQAQGTVEIESIEGQGTLVRLYFPQSDGPVGALNKSVAVETTTSGNGTILVAEDEERVRTLVVDVLSAKGYNVIAATDGENALHIAQRQDQGPIDLLISDIVMPKISGHELAEAFSNQRPATKILLMTGYSKDALPDTLTNGIKVYHLDKPFSVTALASRVREILEQ